MLDVTRLFTAINDAPLAQIVGREFDSNLIAREDTDVVLPHLAGNMRRYRVTVGELHAERGVGQRISHAAFHLNGIFFRHESPGLTKASGGVAQKRANCA